MGSGGNSEDSKQPAPDYLGTNRTKPKKKSKLDVPEWAETLPDYMETRPNLEDKYGYKKHLYEYTDEQLKPYFTKSTIQRIRLERKKETDVDAEKEKLKKEKKAKEAEFNKELARAQMLSRYALQEKGRLETSGVAGTKNSADQNMIINKDTGYKTILGS